MHFLRSGAEFQRVACAARTSTKLCGILLQPYFCFEAEFAVDAPVRKHHVEEAAGKMRNLNLIDLEFVERCVFGAMLQS